MQQRRNVYSDLVIIVDLILLIWICLGIGSCNKLVEVTPPTTSLNKGNVYLNDETAIAYITGIYANMASGFHITSGITSLSLYPALSADELILFPGSTSTEANAYFLNALTSSNIGLSDYWSTFYKVIFITNSAIEGLNDASTLTPQVKQQLLGEAKFMRGFCYFYLVNLYENIPLVLSSDYKINTLLSQTERSTVYRQIISDLKDSQALLNENYVAADGMSLSSVRVRPNKATATALLARTFLYYGDNANAEVEATKVINNSLYNLDNVGLNEVFLIDSKEAIWQLQPVRVGWNTEDAQLFILPTSGPASDGEHPVYLSEEVVRAFELGDDRKTNWISNVKVNNITYSYPYKYKSSTLNTEVTEYKMVFRLAEQYLIRAEARVQQNDIVNGINDLNVLRKRARANPTVEVPDPLPNLSIEVSKAEALNAILHERQVELFTEWGHRWLDLKRMGFIDIVMNKITREKGGIWDKNWQLYPIPFGEIQKDRNLLQNEGY